MVEVSFSFWLRRQGEGHHNYGLTFTRSFKIRHAYETLTLHVETCLDSRADTDVNGLLGSLAGMIAML
jgi:hypothetical protein